MSLQPGSSYVNYLAVKKLLPLDEQANPYPSTTIFAVDGSGTYAGYAPADWFTAIGIPNPSTIEGELVSTIGIINTALPSTVRGLGSSGYVSTQTLDTALASTVGGLATTTGVTYAEFDAAIKGLGTTGYVSSTQLTSTVAGLGSSGYLSTGVGGILSVAGISTGGITLSTVSLADITNPASNTLLYNNSGNLYFGATLIGANPTDLSLNTIDVSNATVYETLTVGGSITAPISYSEIVNTIVVNATKTALLDRTWAVAGTFGGGDYGTQFSTNDGASWDLSAHLFSGAANGTTYLNGRWYALGLFGVLNGVDNMGIYYSTDDGASWVAPPSPSGTNFINADIQGIAYNGTSYMLVGQKTGPRIWTSTDGINWTYITSPANMTTIYRVLFNGTYWVIVGQGTEPIQYSADDGNTWTAATDSFTGLEFFKKLAYNGFTLVVADTNNGNIHYSENKGQTWTTVVVGGTEMTALAWNGTYFVAATDQPALYYSRNGRTWTRSPSIPAESVLSIFWNGRTFKGVGASTYTYESSDGRTWIQTSKTYTLTNPGYISYSVYVGDDLVTENGRYYGVDVPHFYDSTNQFFTGPDRTVINNTLTIGNGVVGVMKGDPAFHVDVEGALRASTLMASTIQLADPIVGGSGATLYARGGAVYVNGIPIVQSTVAGLGQTYVSVPSLTSTVAGLGQTYVSTQSLTSTVSAVGNNLTSTVAGLGQTYVSVPSLTSTVAGLGQTYISIPSLTSTVAGLGQTYISIPSLTSTVAGIRNNFYISSFAVSTMSFANFYTSTVYVGNDNLSTNTVRFRGTINDYGPYINTVIGERVFQASERSELLLFKGNDPTISGGGDRIRFFAPAHQFDVTRNDFITWNENQDPPVAQIPNVVYIDSIAGPSGAVGINTTSLSFNLDVSGTSRFTGTIQTDSNITMASGTAAAPALTFTGDTNNGIYRPGADTLAIATGGVERLQVDSGGRVGIGRTPAAGYALDVSGGYGRIQNYVNEAGLDFLAGGIFSIRRTNVTNGDAQLFNFGTGSMNFATNGTSGRMVIDGSGSVAIGTAGVVNSAAKVTIQNDLCLVTGANSSGSGGSVYFGIEQFPTYSPMGQIKGLLANTTGSEVQGGIGFFTRPFGSAGQVLRERVRITNEGFVGIGISTPTQTLDVSGTGRVTGAFSKGSGTFDIQHPLHPSKRLVHSFIEGPRCDNIYRGVVQLVDGKATVDLDAECVHQPVSAMSAGTFESLCANPMVYLQNNESFDRVKGSVQGGTLTIICESPTASIHVNWLVVAERKDPLVKAWDRTNENGYLITEYTP